LLFKRNLVFIKSISALFDIRRRITHTVNNVKLLIPHCLGTIIAVLK
jgi:hypothetical protein